MIYIRKTKVKAILMSPLAFLYMYHSHAKQYVEQNKQGYALRHCIFKGMY